MSDQLPSTPVAPPSQPLELEDIRSSKELQAELIRFQSAELKKGFEARFGIAGMAPWAIGGFAATVVIFLVTWVILFALRVGFILASITLLYMLIQSLFVGALTAALVVVARVLQQLAAIVNITIFTLGEALRRTQDVAEGRVSFAELSAGLIHGAFVPTVQNLITVKLGLLRLPISFFANRLIKRVARMLTRSLRSKDLDQQASELDPGDPSQLNSTLVRGESHLNQLQERVDVIARRTRRVTLIPAALFLLVVTTLSSLPWLLLYLATL